MADLTITAANVTLVSGTTGKKNATGTIGVGQPLYADSTSTVAQASNAAGSTDEVVGISLNAATAGQPVVYAMNNAVVGFGAILTVTETYVLSASGLISPIGDIATNDYVTRLGYGLTASNMQLDLKTFSLQAP